MDVWKYNRPLNHKKALGNARLFKQSLLTVLTTVQEYSQVGIYRHISIIKYTAEHGKDTGKQSTPKHLKHINK